MKKALVILSGGQDSVTCLFWAINKGYDCSALTFDYDQLHKIEVESAIKVAQIAGIKNHEILSIGPLFSGKSPLTNKDVPLDQFSSLKEVSTGIQKTFVPGRNLLFLSLAANKAYSRNIDTMITGICEEDFGGYPDCRKNFIESLEKTIFLALEKKIEILTPLINMKKSEIVMLAKELPKDCWEALSFSHTSYDGRYPPTSNDHANLLRARGFEEAGYPDPLVERAVMENLMERPKTKNYENKD
ncbi:7-cyano-7-deazaguanine synthase QueC [bacterium]|nr:7-cyano-7-deazaguanine synthase QueC [bacterium]|tara:strand:+ start:12722 stop:13453 length:732 start_codon:yes stop_codon:yes gene_type:complete